MEDSYVLQMPARKFNDLYLCFCGYAKCKPLHSFGPAVRPNYIIHYILEGKGRYYVGDRQYELSAGQGFLIEPEVQTFYQADQENPWSYIWVGFNGTNAKTYLRDIGLNSNQLLYRCNHGKELKSLIIDMLKHNTYSNSDQFLLQSSLYSFFSILTRDITILSSSPSGNENLYIRKAIEYIQNNYFYSIQVTDIANYVCINRSYLYTLFRQYLQVSPQDYLTNYRITRATELLTTTDLPIGGVAKSCGYMDALVFSKKFKSIKGLTPSQYRKERLSNQQEYLKQNQERLEKL